MSNNAMTEFKITSDLSALRGQVIEANFDEVREWLTENLEPYRNMTVTEDMIPTAKSYRANIRKVADRIDASRKEAKAAALAAYTEFETKCKTLTGLCSDAANAIDSQVKAFENAEKEAKIEALKAFYEDCGTPEAKEYCPWERIFNPKWENKGYAAESAQAEIRNMLNSTMQDLETIRGMSANLNDRFYLMDIYKSTHEIGLVVRKNTEMLAVRQREEQRKREEDAARKEREKVEEAPAQTVIEPQEVAATFEPEKPSVVTVDFRVTCTKAQLTALGNYMKQNGIRYGRVPDDR